jgi:hypothetical protein
MEILRSALFYKEKRIYKEKRTGAESLLAIRPTFALSKQYWFLSLFAKQFIPK